MIVRFGNRADVVDRHEPTPKSALPTRGLPRFAAGAPDPPFAAPGRWSAFRIANFVGMFLGTLRFRPALVCAPINPYARELPC